MSDGSLERQNRLMRLLEGALEQPREERQDFLDQQCAGDLELRDEALQLLETRAGDALPERPLFDVHHEPPPPLEQKTIGPYQVRRLLQRGGMGAVYLAERADFEKQVALKVIRRGLDLDDVLVRRFHNERQILARLEHPHIAQLHDGGTTEDHLPFFVMEYVDGEPIDLYVRGHELPLEATLRLFLKVCGAVDFAHRNLVVHRDLKPANILIDPRGEPKLLDFGIAKLLDQADPTAFTRSGESMMTPRYASPEQIQQQPITTAVDVYALGVMLYEMLTGVSPYRLKTERGDELAQAILEQPAELPSRAVQRRSELGARRSRRLRGDLDKILLKALAKNPEERYGSARDLAQDLERHLNGMPVSASTASWTYRSLKFVRRYFWGVLVLVAFMVTLVGFTLYSNDLRKQAELATAEAEAQRDRANEEAVKAEDQKDQAEEAQRNEAALKRFLEDLLKQASPNAQGQSDMKVTDLIDLGIKLVEERILDLSIRREIYNELGKIALELHKWEAATAAFNRALEIERSQSDKDVFSNKALVYWANLASVDSARGSFRNAEEVYRDILEIRNNQRHSIRQKLGNWSNLSTALMMRGAFDEALELSRRVDKETPDAFMGLKTRDERIARAKNSLAMTYFVMNDLKAARSTAEEATEAWGQLDQEDHKLRRATNLDLLGRLDLAEGKLDSAREFLMKAYGIRQDIARDLSTLWRSQLHLAELEIVAEKYEAAEDWLDQAIAGFRRGKAQEWRLQEALSVQGELWTRQGRRGAEVERQLREAAGKLAEIRGKDSRPAIQAATRLEEYLVLVESEHDGGGS